MNILVVAFIVFAFGGLVSGAYRHNQTASVHAISNAEAGYNQDAYDACIDQADTTEDQCAEIVER